MLTNSLGLWVALVFILYASVADGLIQVSALADRVEKRVPEITREQQFPMRLIKGQNFPIAKKQ